MADHASHIIERHCDVAVIGGSASGLSAALQLGRQRRSVIVIDSGDPRNAPAAHMHSFLGLDGAPPSALIAAGSEEVRRYGGEILIGWAEEVTGDADGGFRVRLAGGHTVVARRVLVATGLTDQLPEIEGLSERWGADVIHCPFCHGFEVRDRRIVQIITHPSGIHTAGLFRQLTDQLTVVFHGEVEADDEALATLRAAGVEVRMGPILRIASSSDGHLDAVELESGERLEADAVAVGPRFAPRVKPFLSLGLRPVPHSSGLGDVVEADASGATSVPGLYAAGNVTDPSQQVLQAAAHGSRIGGLISFSLAHEDLVAAARRSANEADWEHRYAGDQMWSGNPNGTVVAEASNLVPGRALDVGAGEGGDAIWLARRGWDVTANDISQRALDRIAEEAARQKLTIRIQRADANGVSPFEAGAFQLVSAAYASIPRTPDDRGVSNLLEAVAPGGVLLVVSHDLEPMRRPVDPQHQSRIFDPDAYVRTEDFLRVSSTSPGGRSSSPNDDPGLQAPYPPVTSTTLSCVLGGRPEPSLDPGGHRRSVTA